MTTPRKTRSKKSHTRSDNSFYFPVIEPSVWPLISAIGVLILAIGLVLSLHQKHYVTLIAGCCIIIGGLVGWWRDMTRESDQPGFYSNNIYTSLKIGMVLFIASEVMLFAALFIGYFFYSDLTPHSATWLPQDLKMIDPLGLPYTNTLLLLLSGTSVTWAHNELHENGSGQVIFKALLVTVGLGLLFTAVQCIEYAHVPFELTQGIYPSLFYLMTGFHGFHVVIGTIFLGVCCMRARQNVYQPEDAVGLDAAAWYWHFVDVVWLLLFISVYWWDYRP